MPDHSPKSLILEKRIAILADKIVEQSSAFDKMQNKMFLLVGLLLTIGGLLSYDIFKIQAPDVAIESILLVAALILLAIASVIVGYDYRARKNWLTPIGPVEEVKLDRIEGYEEALELIHEDYHAVYVGRNSILDVKAKYLNIALSLIVISVILLIVLKVGGQS